MSFVGPTPRPGRAKPGTEEDENELLVFGYGCRLFPNDENAERIAEERHLCTWLETDIQIDRFDVRMLVHSFDDLRVDRTISRNDGEFSHDAMEEEMCQEERFRDLYEDIQKKALEEEENKRKRAEIGFNYDEPMAVEKVVTADGDSDSEDEPFEAPEGVKLPVGLECPSNQKLNHIILRTAGFVVEKGPQMEIVIKAKQRNNLDQFGFLQFDHLLNPYYKYMMKMIREKKYVVPDFSRQKRQKRDRVKAQANAAASLASSQGQDAPKKLGALAGLATMAGSDSDSDSDCELHPSLLARSRRGTSPDPVDASKNGIGPRRKPLSPPPRPPAAPKLEYNLTKANDMYASLFKSMSLLKEELSGRPAETAAESASAATEGEHDVDFQHWWSWFYGAPCTQARPAPLVPPPPDLGSVVDTYAQYSAEHGAQGEQMLRERAEKEDMPVNFLQADSPHHSYYQHKIRIYQWQWGIYPPRPPAQAQQHIDTGTVITGQPLLFNAPPTTSALPHSASEVTVSVDSHPPPLPTTTSFSPVVTLTITPLPPVIEEHHLIEQKPSTHVHQALPTVASAPVLATQQGEATTEEADASTEQPRLNRRQRRRLQDAPRVAAAAPPSIVDSISMAIIGGTELPKTRSFNALQAIAAIDSDEERGSSPEIEASTAALFDQANEGTCERATGSASPISFSLSVKKSHKQVSAAIASTAGMTASASAPCLQPLQHVASPVPTTLTPCPSNPLMVPAPLQGVPPVPTPPAIQNDLQLERKEKARLFMERILRDKQQKRRQEQEELEQQQKKEQEERAARKAAEERREMEEGEVSSPARDADGRRRRRRSRSRSPKAVDLIDQLIDKKINSLLANTVGISLAEADRATAADEGTSDVDEKKKKKKHKKGEKSKKRRHGSRSPSSERSHKRRRSRSRSRDRKR